MKQIYSNQKYEKNNKSIFLAGPTPREKEIQSWRKEAISYFEELGFDGVLYIPEESNKAYYSEEGVVEDMSWDQNALEEASVVMFWIPRNKDMPALTTNVEFGYLINSGKIVYGRPDDSIKNEYLDWLYQRNTQKTPCNNLKELVRESITLLNEK